MPDTLSRSVAEARVRNGMEWLDVEYSGWEHSIDLAILDLACPRRCVLGQICPVDIMDKLLERHPSTSEQKLIRSATPYSLVQLYHGSDSAWTIDHGFASWNADYVVLQECWVEAIKRRFDTGVFSDS